ncbi:MAG: AEC family transporter [Firmicutes bacterium]|nr:AEC family transporter [Bacillota bacterium]
MATTQIVISLVKLFLMIIPGLLLSKAGALNEQQSKGISSVVVNVTWPCLIVMSLQREFSRELVVNMGILALLLIANMIVAFLLARLACRALKMDRAKTYLMTFMLIVGNTGFMGIPVCNALYGAEGTFYAALIDSIFDIFIFTGGMIMIEKSTGKHIGLSPKHFLTPGFISILVGLALFVARISLPEIISGPMDVIGSATGPLAMMIVGFQLGKLRLRDFAGDLPMYVLCVCKLLVLPLIFLIVVRLLFPDMPLLAKVLAVELATPVGVVSTIYTQQYDGDVQFATRGVMLSTVLSLLTLTLFAIAAEMISAL